MQQETVIQQFAQRIAVRIAVDDRERSSGVALALWQRPGINIAIRRLKLGDYQVDDTLLVERKTLADFALSVRDCRLFTQLGRLTRQRKMRTCLILEGTPERYPLSFSVGKCDHHGGEGSRSRGIGGGRS